MAPLIRVLAGIGAAVVPLLAQQAHVNLDWAPHRNTQNLKPYGAAPISPEVRGDPRHIEKTFDLFEAELKRHIVPLVAKTYCVRADRRGRAPAGLSMGGRHAQLVGFRNANLYLLPKLFR